MAKKNPSKKEDVIIRKCANIKSRKHPDIQCPLEATQGEFCARHYKNPVRFCVKSSTEHTSGYIANKAANKIQNAWRLYRGLLKFKQQGPAANYTHVAENQTDLYTLDSVATISSLYRWSYADKNKHIWLFDIRSLSMTRAEDSQKRMINPYTREEFSVKAEQQYQERIAWLRAKKYCLTLFTDTELTEEQRWHQKILDTTLKYDMLGYHTCLRWFEDLSQRQLIQFYNELWELWTYRLQLDPSIKDKVVPNYLRPNSLLFKWTPLELRYRHESKHWWQKVILELLDKLVSSAQLKEHKILGALYGMTAFAIISPTVRSFYPWLVEMEDED